MYDNREGKDKSSSKAAARTIYSETIKRGHTQFKLVFSRLLLEISFGDDTTNERLLLVL